jgi:hypothetical protein
LIGASKYCFLIKYPFIQINNQKSKVRDIQFSAYYVDYLCVDTNYRNQNIALELMQTHIYNQRYMNKNIVVSLFKREKKLDIAMPLCEVTSYLYSIKEIHNENMPHNIKLIKVGKDNINHFYDFIKLNYIKFEIYITTSIANLLELIKTENIIIYMLIQETQVISIYYFKKTCMYVNERKSQAVGKSSYKVGLPVDALLSSQNVDTSFRRSSLRRVRSGGCVAPAKKGSIYNTSLRNGQVCGWGAIPRSTY